MTKEVTRLRKKSSRLATEIRELRKRLQLAEGLLVKHEQLLKAAFLDRD